MEAVHQPRTVAHRPPTTLRQPIARGLPVRDRKPKRALDKFAGALPCDFESLTSLHGVGPKCANLVLGIVCREPHGVAVDIHVHRVTNRWGYVSATNPEQTMLQLQQKLPRNYWIEINK